MSFRDRFPGLDARLCTSELNILVWGPAPTAGPDGKKRQDVKDRLKSTFPRADVSFSEELADVPPNPTIPLTDRELYHLDLCDICIVLDTSVGAAAEIAHYTRTALARKMYILTHERYKGAGSFAAAVRELGYQVFYSQDEYDSCNVIERILWRVKTVALEHATKA